MQTQKAQSTKQKAQSTLNKHTRISTHTDIYGHGGAELPGQRDIVRMNEQLHGAALDEFCHAQSPSNQSACEIRA